MVYFLKCSHEFITFLKFFIKRFKYIVKKYIYIYIISFLSHRQPLHTMKQQKKLHYIIALLQYKWKQSNLCHLEVNDMQKLLPLHVIPRQAL